MASSNGQQLNEVVVTQPLNVVKDPVILHRLEKAFIEQIKEVKRKARDPQHNEQALVVPVVPVPEVMAAMNDKFHRILRKSQHKRRRTTSKILFEVLFSFQPPTFCLEENVDLEKVLLNDRFRERTTRGNHVPKFSVSERLQNWLLECCKDDTKNERILQDCFYHHSPSQQKLRSQTEVVTFLLHGDFPLKGGRKKPKVSSLAYCESNTKEEMSSYLREAEILNKMKSSDEKER